MLLYFVLQTFLLFHFEVETNFHINVVNFWWSKHVMSQERVKTLWLWFIYRTVNGGSSWVHCIMGNNIQLSGSFWQMYHVVQVLPWNSAYYAWVVCYSKNWFGSKHQWNYKLMTRLVIDWGSAKHMQLKFSVLQV